MTLLKERIRELMMAELKEGKLRWWWVSMAAPGKFGAAFVVRCLGPTHYTYIIHTMDWYIQGCSTQGFPLDEEAVAKIPEDMRWRPLTRAEAESLQHI